MVDWAYVNGMGEEGGDPDLEHHDPAGHLGAHPFRWRSKRVSRQAVEKTDRAHSPRCRYCGDTGVFWSTDGGRWVLFSNASQQPHHCAPNADGFKPVENAHA